MNDREEIVRVEKGVYGGDGLAHTAEGKVRLLPFTLPGERVRIRPFPPSTLPEIVEASRSRVAPGCVHFGVCGGCHYQMADYAEQVELKWQILRETLEREGAHDSLKPKLVPSPAPWGYRNRIRLHVVQAENELRLGYHRRSSRELLPVTMCPIAAPALWSAVEVLRRQARTDAATAAWLRASAEVELACDADETTVQVHLLCPGAVPTGRGGLEPVRLAMVAAGCPVGSLGASRLHAASGRALEVLASTGKDGFPYRVDNESFWLRRGSFFQVNRFLLPKMVELVTGQHRGALAWDFFAGVGLFSRALAQSFDRVTAVEANASAIGELRRGLRPGVDEAVEATTLAFLRRAALQRDRPELVVLDPPRAGLGEEAATLLVQLRPATIVYVSCDPTTLARDLRVFGPVYGIADLHMVDLFPQTYHLETVMVLRRRDVAE